MNKILNSEELYYLFVNDIIDLYGNTNKTMN